MLRSALAAIIACALLFASCQKEVDWDNADGGGGSGGGSSNGDLLVKALQVTPSTNDTNTILLGWDANKRLVSYKSAGKVNGTATDISYVIKRLSDGKVNTIISKSSLMAGFLDSIKYEFHYNGAQLAYVIDTQFTLVGPVRDSIAFTYVGGKIYSKQSFTDFFGMSESSKETFTYDANGNLTIDSLYSPDGSGGYDVDGVTKYTYNTHKNAVVAGEAESMTVLGASNVSPNYINKMEVNSASAGTSYTTTVSGVTYNSFDRPSASTFSVTPVPPGYTMKLTFFYQ